MNGKIIDVSKIIEFFSNSPAGLKLIDETNKQESAQRKAIAERLAELRQEESATMPALWKAEATALERLHEARKRADAAEREYLKASQDRWGMSMQLSQQASLLEDELREGAPIQVVEFIKRAQEIISSRQYPGLTQAMIDGIDEVVAKAKLLLIEPSVTEALKRLARIEGDLPSLAS